MGAYGRPVAGRDGLAVLDADEIRRALTRIAHEILERTHGGDEVVLLGIPTRGVPLARRLAARIGEFEGLEVPCGSLDVTMHRDDLRLRPARALGRTDLPASGVDGKTVVLVDDVLYSGRTVRAALDALTDLGRPQAVQLAVLVESSKKRLTTVRPRSVGSFLIGRSARLASSSAVSRMSSASPRLRSAAEIRWRFMTAVISLRR